GGGRQVAATPPLDSANGDRLIGAGWSPDGRWITFLRVQNGKPQLVKIDSSGQGGSIPLTDKAPTGHNMIYGFTRWRSDGKAIAYFGQQGIRICAPDGSGDRLLVARGLGGDFNRAGNLFYAIVRNDAAWKLVTLEVATGRIIRDVAIDDSPAAQLANASLHPD